MKAAFDNSFLTLLLNPKGRASVAKAAGLVDDLVQQLGEKRAKIIIPAPSLTEVLIKAPKSSAAYLEKIKEFSCFQVRAFDEKSAVELAERLIASIGKTRTKSDVSKAKVTFDRQIVAVAKAHGANQVYSDDKQVRDFAEECGMEGLGFSDLKLSAKQQKLPYAEAEGKPIAGSPPVRGSSSGPTEG